MKESKIFAAQNISKQQLHSVMLRNTLKNKKVLKLFQRTPQESRALINSILQAQGFNS